jgi:medium-chain acyl-[acyl-carrier-protein] hydrolase
MYSFPSRIRYSELNHQDGSLSCSSIINYFQDCSTFHSEDLNLGLSYLNSKNRVWLLNGWQLQIDKTARLGDYITVSTWPYDFNGFYGYRNFIMKNDKEEVLVAANSIWVYLDTTTGRPMNISDDNAGYTLEPPYPMKPSGRKIKIPDSMTAYPSFPVIKANIDSYHHVNNGQYVKMAEEYLPVDFIVNFMRVEYRMQAVLGDIIVPMVSKGKDIITVVLTSLSNKPYAVIEFLG